MRIRFKTLRVLALGFLAVTVSFSAQAANPANWATFNSISAQNWSATASWTAGTGVPTSGTNLVINFDPSQPGTTTASGGISQSFTSNNDLGTVQLNIFNLSGSSNGSARNITIAGGTLEFSGSSATINNTTSGASIVTYIVSSDILLDTDLSVNATGTGATTLVSSGSSTLSANSAGLKTITITGGSTTSIGGSAGSVISDGLGQVGFVMAGTGSLTMGGANTFTGDVIVKSGTLVQNSSSAGTTTSFGTGTIKLGDTAAGNANATVQFTAHGSSSTITNAITVQAGNSGTKTIANVGGNYTLTLSGLITLNDDLTAVYTGGGGGVINIGNTTTGNFLTGSKNLIVNSNGTGSSAITLTGSNAGFTGSVIVNSGTFQVKSVSALSAANTVVVDSLTNAPTFNIGNIDQTIAGLNNGTNGGGTVTNLGAAAHTLTLAGSGTYSFSGAITGTGAGSNMALTVALTGGGEQTLGGNNTYTGATNVKSGILNLTGALGNTAVTVGNSTTSSLTPTLTGGIGSPGGTLTSLGNSTSRQVYASSSTVGNIIGAVTISGTSASGSAGRFAPGNNGVGTMTVGALTLSGGAILNYEFNGSANDFAVVTGALTLNSGTVGINLYQEGGTGQFTTSGTYDLFQYGSLVGSVSNLSVLNPVGGDTYLFGTSTTSGTDYVTLTITSSGSAATATTYSLAAAVGNTNVLVNHSTSVSSTITNTGSGSADTLSYTGLTGTSTGGVITGAATNSGSPLGQGVSGTNSGLTFTAGATSGTFAITPAISGSATNGTIGGLATGSGTTSATVHVFDAASFTSSVSGSNIIATNMTGANRASASVTSDGGLSNNEGFNNIVVSGTRIDAGGGVTVATFDPTNRLNGTYTATKTLGFNDVTNTGASIAGGSGDSASIGLSVTVSGQTAGAGVAFSAPVASGQQYGTTIVTGSGAGGTSSGFGLTDNIPGSAHVATTATLLNGTASADTTVTMSFNTVPSAGAGHDNAFRSSDILTLGGIVANTGGGTNHDGVGPDGSFLTDVYVLQLSYDPSAVGPQYIGWYDATKSQWVNAIAGNSNAVLPGSYFGNGEFDGSYALYLSEQSSTVQNNIELQLGAFGFDSSTDTAWAVLDHNSEFAVIPEPGTWGMILSGFGMLIGFQKLRRRRVGT